MKNHETLSPEIIAAVKDIIAKKLGDTFDQLLEFYQDEDLQVTEKDLISDILDAGEEQKVDTDTFEDVVMIGYIALAGQYGLIDSL